MDERTRAGHPDDFEGLPEVDPNGFTYPELDVTALPPGFDVKKLDKVLSHMNRLWFANSTDLALYYLPVQTMTGTMSVLPLNAYFKRGGTIRAITTWTLDGGAGMNAMLVIFSTNGEAAIYTGADPDAVDGSFKLVGRLSFRQPDEPRLRRQLRRRAVCFHRHRSGADVHAAESRRRQSRHFRPEHHAGIQRRLEDVPR